MSEPAGTPPVPEIPKPKLKSVKTPRGPKGKFVSKAPQIAVVEIFEPINWNNVILLTGLLVTVYFIYQQKLRTQAVLGQK